MAGVCLHGGAKHAVAIAVLSLFIAVEAGAQPPFLNPYDAMYGMRGGEVDIRFDTGFTAGAPRRQPLPRPVSADFLRHPLSRREERKLKAAHELGLKGKHEEALKALRPLLNANTAPYVYNLTGIESMALGRVADAVQNFARVVEIMPHTSANYSNYGVALARAGELQGAKRALQKALELDKENQEASEVLAIIEAAERKPTTLATSRPKSH